jgi:hypothetical protein
MINLQISLPDDLAQDAKELGLLQPEKIIEVLRAEVRKLACEHLLGIADKLAAAGNIPMSEEEIQEEIRAARRDQHAARS